MIKFSCPSCGAEIRFRTSIAAFAVCPYCRTMVVRQDDDIKKLGVMAALPDDMSPFQIGTEGYYRGTHFGIVGRMRIGWDDGCWNEWFMISDDQRRGWLAEAQGFYAPCFEMTEPPDKDLQETLHHIQVRLKMPGTGVKSLMGFSVRLTKATYTIVDIKDAECVGSEGELPFSAPQGRKTTTIDLGHEDGLFASIELAPEGPRIFEGNYVEWPDLRCSNYRQFEGW